MGNYSRTARLLLGLSGTVFLPLFLLATAQMSDEIVIGGKSYPLFTNPLRPYLEINPKAIPRSNTISSALWRGYIAFWEVKDNRLFLTDIQIYRQKKNPDGKRSSDELTSVIGEVFPAASPVLAVWYTGHIVVPHGKQKNYVHMGYGSTYERYIVLRVEQGQVTRNARLKHKEFVRFSDAQFAAFKATDEYKALLAESRKESDMSDKDVEQFHREFYSERYNSMIFDSVQFPEGK